MFDGFMVFCLWVSLVLQVIISLPFTMNSSLIVKNTWPNQINVSCGVEFYTDQIVLKYHAEFNRFIIAH